MEGHPQDRSYFSPKAEKLLQIMANEPALHILSHLAEAGEVSREELAASLASYMQEHKIVEDWHVGEILPYLAASYLIRQSPEGVSLTLQGKDFVEALESISQSMREAQERKANKRPVFKLSYTDIEFPEEMKHESFN